MTAAEPREAMIGAASVAGLPLEPSLVETLLADLGDEPGSLPLLSHALFATWQRRRGRVLAVAGYQQAGGVRQTIAHSAERVFGALSPTPQGIAKDVEAQDDEDYGKGGAEEHPGIASEIDLRLADHRAPFGGGRLHAQAQEAER